jgi:hypothetical protein
MDTLHGAAMGPTSTMTVSVLPAGTRMTFGPAVPAGVGAPGSRATGAGAASNAPGAAANEAVRGKRFLVLAFFLVLGFCFCLRAFEAVALPLAFLFFLVFFFVRFAIKPPW